MAGKTVSDKSAVMSAATAQGVATIPSTTGWYKGARGAMNAGGQPNVSIVITEIISSTTLGVRIVSDQIGGATSGFNAGRSDISAYNGGTLYQHNGFVYNNDDQPLA